MGWVVETLDLTRISSGVERFQGQEIFYCDGAPVLVYSTRQ
jgi:hypothetical protein